MGKFTAKVILLLSTLLFGLILGIQQAEQGIISIKGIQENEKESFYIQKIDDGNIQVAVLGEAFSTKDWEEKQEDWKQRHHHNRISSLGNKLGETVYMISRKSAEWFVRQIDKVL
jgi:hypothetical protein